jgi:hypothetical protein
MDTPSHIAGLIVHAVLGRFADDNGIARGHLTVDRDSLTAVEIARATRVLGAEVIFDGR